jgi:N-methylhydantoinase A
MQQYRMGVDVGGTFTDVVLPGPDGSLHTLKLLSSPDDYGRAIAAGVEALLNRTGVAGAAINELVHGTTVATNAVLEGTGAPTGLLTTRGFRDVLEIRRIRVPIQYDLTWEKPRALVPRERRLEVDERINARGEVERPLDMEQVRRAVEQLRERGAETLAVCLLNSYANAVHEREIGAWLDKNVPTLPYTLSTDVVPEIGEYERTSTTAINAYLLPLVRSYLDSLREKLAKVGVNGRLLVMQSQGGIAGDRTAALRPAYIVESGPAAGAIAAAALARATGCVNAIAFDMGGTTAKSTLIEGGRLRYTTEYEVGAGMSAPSWSSKGGGYALKLPVVDVAEVGAGGGSIVTVDAVGSVKVGPRSAGAVPGPACYARGGTEPTVTDANVVLGYLNPAGLLGGAMPIDAERARRAIEEHVAKPLGCSVAQAAWGIHLVANAAMTRGVKAVSTQRGRDVREFTLIAFGGSGPVHAVHLARAMGIKRVIIPLAPGLFSAVGLLLTDIEHDFTRTHLALWSEVDTAALLEAFRDLESQAETTLGHEGLSTRDATWQRSVDVRYRGQSHALSVPLEDFNRDRMPDVVGAFEREHELTYGHRPHGAPVELVHVRLRASVPRPRPVLRAGVSAYRPTSPREVWFADRAYQTPVLTREMLGTDGVAGPLIVEEYDTAVVVPPGAHAALDDQSNIHIVIADDGA